MNDDQPFLDAIRESPDDDAVRLVYSDWLEDHGDAARAEFVRTQVELARGVADEARRDLLRRRERELLLANERKWLGALGAVVKRASFVRGFVERVTVHVDRLKDAAAQFGTAPIRHLILLGAKQMTAVAAVEALGRITTLDLREGCTLTAKGVREIAASPHLAGVTYLILRQMRLEESTATALAEAPRLSRLRTLDLYGWWHAHPVARIARSRHLAGLTTLILGGTDELTGEDVGPLYEAGCPLTSLRRLHLAYGQMNDVAARWLAGAPHLAGLERLDVAGNPFTRAGRRALKARFGERVRL